MQDSMKSLAVSFRPVWHGLFTAYYLNTKTTDVVRSQAPNDEAHAAGIVGFGAVALTTQNS
eukprot:5373031-Amphidinium_carterae.1